MALAHEVDEMSSKPRRNRQRRNVRMMREYQVDLVRWFSPSGHFVLLDDAHLDHLIRGAGRGGKSQLQADLLDMHVCLRVRERSLVQHHYGMARVASEPDTLTRFPNQPANEGAIVIP